MFGNFYPGQAYFGDEFASPNLPSPPVNQLVPTGVGSTDWAGGRGPLGGTHTGTATITMVDAATYVVAHGVAEAQRKRDVHAIAPEVPAWVAFDQPATAVPLILDVSRIASVT